MGPPIFFGNSAARGPAIIAFWVVFYVWFVSELWLGWRRRPPRTTPTRDRGSQLIVVIGVWLSVLLGIGLASAVRTTALPSGRTAFVAIGTALMLAGLMLRWYAIALLGRFFTVAVTAESGQPVIDRGPYRLIRHPSYAGSLLTILGVVVACANPVALLGLLPAGIAYAYRIQVEERALATVLGEPYRAYMRRTRRLIPYLI